MMIVRYNSVEERFVSKRFNYCTQTTQCMVKLSPNKLFGDNFTIH